MKKDFIICLCTVLIGASGWLGMKQYDQYQARKFAAEQAAAALAAQQAQAQEKQKAIQAVQGKKQAEQRVAQASKAKTLVADRQAVEKDLAGHKLSSIMQGSPNIAIIDKKEYEPGSELALSAGRSLTVVSMDNDAVVLTDGQQNYRLGLPTARDLGSVAR